MLSCGILPLSKKAEQKGLDNIAEYSMEKWNEVQLHEMQGLHLGMNIKDFNYKMKLMD